MIFDSHAHYDDEKFNEDRESILSSMQENNIGTIVNVGADILSSKSTLKLAEEYPFIYAAIGVHPSDVDCLNEESFDWLKEHLKGEKVVALGEIGLDYYWEKDEERKENQRKWFREQFMLAKKEEMPIIIHSRDAAQDTFEMMKEMGAEDTIGVVHCYSYSPELAKEFVKMGYYIGVGGVVTFKNAKKLKETVEKVPMEKILLETDCPYLAPEPNRGKRNSSLNLPYVVAEIAKIRNMKEEDVIAITEENAKRMYFERKK
ncbi:MAG: TatD family hydrolase [Eubacterium sp.]|nr:TatD family hydrolase [Eubacterium sp.]